jgi:plasmid stabilization system protein ParE
MASPTAVRRCCAFALAEVLRPAARGPSQKAAHGPQLSLPGRAAATPNSWQDCLPGVVPPPGCGRHPQRDAHALAEPRRHLSHREQIIWARREPSDHVELRINHTPRPWLTHPSTCCPGRVWVEATCGRRRGSTLGATCSPTSAMPRPCFLLGGGRPRLRCELGAPGPRSRGRHEVMSAAAFI